MKFIVAGVLIAFAACASSGVVPYTYSQWPAYTGSYAQQVAAPVAYSAYNAPITQYSSIDVAYAPQVYAASAPVVTRSVVAPQVYAASAPVVTRSVVAPQVYAASAPVVTRSVVAPQEYAAPTATVVAAPQVYAAPQVVAPVVRAVPVGASYTAANRGAVHQAPLEGHAVSQTSLNLAPAPGTY